MHHKEHLNRAHKHLDLSNLILVLFTTLFTLLVVEFGLRFIGKIPGYVPRYSNQAFKCVSKLEVRQNFLTDDEGVFKANPNYEWSTEYQINSDGFRSIEFKQYKTTQGKILFLGDSFTWGATAKPITNCFVDIVARHGYLTFNTGIPGTSLNQYACLAEKYVPLLRPNIVALVFYMGNDLKPPGPMLPYKDLYHITNAGWLYAFDENGNYMVPQDAYNLYLRKYNAAYKAAYVSDSRKTLKTTIRKVFVKSVIGTYFWVWLSRVKWQLLNFVNQSLTNPSPSDSASHNLTKENNNDLGKYSRDVQNSTKRYLARIMMISQEYGARFLLFLIPAHPGLRNENNSIEDNLHIFEDFGPFIPDFLNRHDYRNLPNDHLNNSGHMKYAEFILRAIERRTQ
jgi:hypothetical protein